jgi:hypothetical protein
MKESSSYDDDNDEGKDEDDWFPILLLLCAYKTTNFQSTVFLVRCSYPDRKNIAPVIVATTKDKKRRR